MGNVVPFGPKNSDGVIAPEKAPLVNASGAEVKTPRSVQNDIMQRRNFVLVDCATGEVVLQTPNLPNAYAALGHARNQVLFNMIHSMSSQAAVDVFKHIAEEGEKQEKQEQEVKAVADAENNPTA